MMIRAYIYSLLYRLTRFSVIRLSYFIQFLTRRKRDLESAERFGDFALSTLQKGFSPLLFNFKIPKQAPVTLFDLTFSSPITFAAFKDHMPMLEQWCQLGVGGGIIKTICLEPRPGNPRPRLQDLPDGLINALGLPGKGIDKTLERLENHKLFSLGRPIGISVGGHHLDDYVEGVRRITRFFEGKLLRPSFLELNISCPNTPDGQNMMANIDLISDLLSKLRETTDWIIGVKVSPDQANDDLEKIAKIVSSFPKIYINAGNTTFRKCEDLGLSSDAISIGGGGMSGSTLFSRTLEMVTLLAPFKCPIIATGGIDSPDKAKAVLDAGATLIGMATGLVKDPYSIVKINHFLAKR